jgi:Ferritin-like domain
MSILSDVKDVEAKVRESMQNGPVTPYYTLPLDKVYEVLNAALASEIICVLRYRQHYYMTTSIHKEQLQGLFKQHWQDEERHLERIADRIKQLGGVPNLDPNGISQRRPARRLSSLRVTPWSNGSRADARFRRRRKSRRRSSVPTKSVDLVAMPSALMCAASTLIRHTNPSKHSAHEHSGSRLQTMWAEKLRHATLELGHAANVTSSRNAALQTVRFLGS